MRNRAKCLKCGDILESFHPTDYVVCKCDEIALNGGSAMLCYAKSFKNFIRINDDGEEVIPTIVEKEVPEADPNQDMTQPPNRQELLSALNDYIKSFDNLPEHAMMTPITHIDLKNSLTIVYAILKDLK